MKETICDIRWEGPFSWTDGRRRGKPYHVLYALYGTHHLYGQDQLLYLGRAEGNVAARLSDHAKWVKSEYDHVLVRLASVGSFPSIEAWWEEWDRQNRRNQKRYKKKADPKLVERIEALLIYAHQPTYNSASKVETDSSLGLLRIFNTGKCGSLLPEISHAYFEE